MKKTIILSILIILISSNLFSQVTISLPNNSNNNANIASSKNSVKIYIPRRVKIEKAVASIDTVIKEELAKLVTEKREENFISENINTEVQAKVIEEVNTQTGETQLNLHVEYKYEVIKAKMESQTDDFPAGKYKLISSNAANVTMQLFKQAVEQQLAEYLTPGTNVTIVITGSTDGSPINNSLPYGGEYGDFSSFEYFLNGYLSELNLTKASGITSNAQLAFLRTYGVRQFIENYILELKNVNLSFQHYAVVAKEVGSQYRKISIEIIIQDAFKNKFVEEENPNQTIANNTNNSNSKVTINANTNNSNNVTLNSNNTNNTNNPVVNNTTNNNTNNAVANNNENNDIDVDINVPKNPENPKRYALIFGNENYIAGGGLNSDVNFAIRDALIFKKYAITTLGIPEDNVIYAENATRSVMRKNIDRFLELMSISPATKEFYIYYAGHGYPDANNEPWLMPVDVSATYYDDGIKLSDFYTKLEKFNTKKTVIFLDACFSGGGRNGSLVEARDGVMRTPKDINVVTNNILIFAAASENQVSKPYTTKKHGMFSYFLFKILQETKGNITYSELATRISESVEEKSILINGEKQMPKVNVSEGARSAWENWKVVD